jgi:hypothetical protein
MIHYDWFILRTTSTCQLNYAPIQGAEGKCVYDICFSEEFLTSLHIVQQVLEINRYVESSSMLY